MGEEFAFWLILLKIRVLLPDLLQSASFALPQERHSAGMHTEEQHFGMKPTFFRLPYDFSSFLTLCQHVAWTKHLRFSKSSILHGRVLLGVWLYSDARVW